MLIELRCKIHAVSFLRAHDLVRDTYLRPDLKSVIYEAIHTTERLTRTRCTLQAWNNFLKITQSNKRNKQTENICPGRADVIDVTTPTTNIIPRHHHDTNTLPPPLRRHPAVLHLRSTLPPGDGEDVPALRRRQRPPPVALQRHLVPEPSRT